MLLIHGKGADEHDLEPLISHLDPEGRFLTVLPRARLPFPPGWEWYRTEGIPRGGPEIMASVDAVDEEEQPVGLLPAPDHVGHQ